MTSWLLPDSGRQPRVRSVGGFDGIRLVFNVGGFWAYYPAYSSGEEYKQAVAELVTGAVAALGVPDLSTKVTVSMDPYGTPWNEWLLPMQGWTSGQPHSPDWDPAVKEYAQLFDDKVLDVTYRKVCISAAPLRVLHYNADLVLRNLAPSSWLIAADHSAGVVYFHNTSSLGICLPRHADVESVVRAVSSSGELHLAEKL